MVNKTTALMVSIILLVVTIIVIFQFVGDSSSSIIDAANSVTDANNCSISLQSDGSTFFSDYNQTSKNCINTSGVDDAAFGAAGQFDLPLNSLFGSSSVALLVMMAAILVMVIFLLIGQFKAKKG